MSFKFEKKYKMKVFEASARDNDNVTEAFIHLTKLAIETTDFNNGIMPDNNVNYGLSSAESKAQRPGGSFTLKRPTNSPKFEESEENP